MMHDSEEIRSDTERFSGGTLKPPRPSQPYCIEDEEIKGIPQLGPYYVKRR